jgi:hypothetical protein
MASRKSRKSSRTGSKKRRASPWAKFVGAYIKKHYRPGMSKLQRQGLMKSASVEWKKK